MATIQAKEISFKMNNQAEVDQLLSIGDLGPLVSMHARAHASSKFRWLMVYVTAGIAAAILLLGAVLAIRSGSTGVLKGAAICALFPGLLAAIGVFDAKRFQDASLAIFQAGLAYRTRNRVLKWCWEDIDAVFVNVVSLVRNGVAQLQRAYTLRNKDGEEFTFGNEVSCPDDALALIKEQVYRRLSMKFAADFDAGRPVAFAKLLVDRQGLTTADGNRVPWTDVANISTARGVTTIETRSGKPLQCNAATVPNHDLLVTLIRTQAVVA